MLSVTVTTCVAVAVLPLPSVTVQVTVVAPKGKLVGASLVVLATEQLSLVVALPKVTFAKAVVHAPASTFTDTAAGAVIVGLMLSVTVTVAVAEAELPAPSTAVNVTVLLPRSEHVKLVTSRDKVNDPLLSVVPLSISEVVILPAPFASRFTVTF